MTSKHFTKVIDKVTGVPHYTLTTRLAAYQQGFYFVNNSMTNDGRYLWFYATVNPIYDTNSRNMGYVDFLLDEVVICYDVLFDDASPYVDPDSGTLYFTHEKSVYMREPGKDKMAVKLCTVPVEGTVDKLATHLTRTSDKEHFFLDIAKLEHGFIQGLINIKTGEFTEWARTKICYDHGQISPITDDVALCASGAWCEYGTGEFHDVTLSEDGTYRRLWLVESNGNHTMYPAMHNYATHEWWSGDGKKIYYCCDNHGIYGIDLDSGKDIVILDGVDPWHCHSTRDDALFVWDEKKLERYGGVWYRGCPSAVNLYNAKTGKNLVIVSEMPENGFTPERQNPYHIDPHPRFTENEKYIVFTTTELGGCDLAIAVVDEIAELTR